jgi:hypothetical protein
MFYENHRRLSSNCSAGSSMAPLLSSSSWDAESRLKNKTIKQVLLIFYDVLILLLLYWRHNPVWLLASSISSSPTVFVFQAPRPTILRFLSALPDYRRLGLPALFVSLLRADISFALVRCPSQLRYLHSTFFVSYLSNMVPTHCRTDKEKREQNEISYCNLKFLFEHFKQPSDEY